MSQAVEGAMANRSVVEFDLFWDLGSNHEIVEVRAVSRTCLSGQAWE